MADGALKGYTALSARLKAVQGSNIGPKLMRTLGMAAVREQKKLVHRKTGNLARTIHLERVSATSATTVASATYAGFVERGTAAHEITPRAKKALSFASQGIVNERFGPQKSIFRLTGTIRTGAVRKFGNAAFIVVKKVHHPGTKAYPFMVPGAQAAIHNADAGDIIAAWNSAA